MQVPTVVEDTHQTYPWYTNLCSYNALGCQFRLDEHGMPIKGQSGKEVHVAPETEATDHAKFPPH